MRGATLVPVGLADLMQEQLPGFVVGIITGLITGVPAGLWVERIKDRRKQREQVRQISGRITDTWRAVRGSTSARTLDGGQPGQELNRRAVHPARC